MDGKSTAQGSEVMKKRRFLFVLIVLVVVALMLVLIKRKQRELAHLKKPQQFRPVVRVVHVKKGILNVYVRYLGEIVPVTETQIASKVTGFIERIFVDDGAKVKRGELLVKIDDRDVRARIRSIDAKIEATSSNLEALRAKIPGLKAAVFTNKGIFDRNKILYKNKAIGKEELDISRKNFELSLSELKATEKSIQALQQSIKALSAEKEAEKVLLSYTEIRAPFDGIVHKKLLSEGDVAVPGKVILSMVNPKNGVKVVVPLAPEDFIQVKTGHLAYLLFNGRKITTRVSSLYPGATKDSLGICNIRMKSSPFGLPYHTKIEVRLVTKTVEGIIAPTSCLLRTGSKNYVLKVGKDKIVSRFPIKLLGKNEQFICFSAESVEPGDTLISGRESFLMRIPAGQPVEIAR